jgi:hypothetical protein
MLTRWDKQIAQVSGILAALCVTGSIFQNVVLHKVSAVLPGYSRSDIVHLTTGTSSSLFQDLSPELKQGVIAQVTDSIRDVFVYVLAVSSLGFVLSLTLSVSETSCSRRNCFVISHSHIMRRFSNLDLFLL